MSPTGAGDEATGGAESAKPQRKVYHASTGRRTVFSFIFVILLPFFLSLPGMLFMRLKHGQIADSIGLAVFAAFFSVLMLLILIELLYSVRARIELGEDKVRLTLPSGRGPSPMLRYATHEVPYDDIKSVETRREVYGGAVIPMLLKGARIERKDGSFVRLGYVSEANVDPAFPYPDVAREIAERARLPLIDRGSVKRSFRTKYLGLARMPRPDSDAIEDADIAVLNRSHSNVILGLVGSLVVMMLIGLVADFATPAPVSSNAFANAKAKPSTASPAGVKPATQSGSKPRP